MTMTTTDAPADALSIPDVFGSEDGDRWWIAGHVEPALAILAVAVSELVCAGPQEAGDFLSAERTFDYERCTVRHRTPVERLAAASALLGQVSHYWAKQDPDNDEMQLPCAEGDPGAEAWTEVSV